MIRVFKQPPSDAKTPRLAVMRRRGVASFPLGWTGEGTQGVRPPDPAAAQIFFLERWSDASKSLRSSRGSATYAEPAPFEARQAGAVRSLDCLRESENIRKALFVDGELGINDPETTNRAADVLGLDGILLIETVVGR